MHQMKKGYPVRVWLTTLLATPALAFLIILFTSGDPSAGAMVALPSLVYSVPLSLPAFLLNIPLCRRVAGSSLTTATAKGYIVGAGLVLIALPFWGAYLWYGKYEDALLFFPAGYMLVSLFAGCVFDLRVKEEVTLRTETV